MTASAHDVGGQFVRSLTAKRWQALCALLASEIDFKGMTPGRFWEAHTPGDVVTHVLRHWFEDTDHIEDLIAWDAGDVADRHWVRYRLHVRNDDGLHVVEQHGYYDLGSGGRVARMHLICAGYRPVPAGASGGGAGKA